MIELWVIINNIKSIHSLYSNMTKKYSKKKTKFLAKLKTFLSYVGLRGQERYYIGESNSGKKYYFDFYIEHRKRNIGIIFFNPENDDADLEMLQRYSEDNNCEIIRCDRECPDDLLFELPAMIHVILKDDNDEVSCCSVSDNISMNSDNEIDSDEIDSSDLRKDEIILKRLELEVLRERNKQMIIEKLL